VQRASLDAVHISTRWLHCKVFFSNADVFLDEQKKEEGQSVCIWGSIFIGECTIHKPNSYGTVLLKRCLYFDTIAGSNIRGRPNYQKKDNKDKRKDSTIYSYSSKLDNQRDTFLSATVFTQINFIIIGVHLVIPIQSANPLLTLLLFLSTI
jgi:hypothetical protein